jgi:ribosomal protein L7/L12
MPNEVFGVDFYKEMVALALSEVKALRATNESIEADRDWRADCMSRQDNLIDAKNVEIDNLHNRLEDMSAQLNNVRADLRMAKEANQDERWMDACRGYDHAWQVFAMMGYRIEAIKEYRRYRNDSKIGLKEAKDAIQLWLDDMEGGDITEREWVLNPDEGKTLGEILGDVMNL